MSGNNHALPDVPPELRSFFTSDQMDELVAQFQMSDADGSGSIDELEFRQLLMRMSLVVSDAEAGDLVASIDTDGNGLIDFPELVSMVVRIKKGDERFAALKKFLETLETTPISLLQREADKFGLSVSYQLIEERPGKGLAPPTFLMELEISGKWCGPSGSEKLQAIGKTTREAKFKVAEAGLVRMKRLKPGLAFDLGVLPPDWESWLFDNIERGGNPKKLMRILREKGFSPANNVLLMQKISARISSRRLRTKRSAPRSVYDKCQVDDVSAETHRASELSSRSPIKSSSVPRRLDPQWVHWCQQEFARGIDGRVVLEELISHGFEPEKNPQFTQSLLRTHKNRGDKSSNGPSNPESSRFSFWNSLEVGSLADTELFVYGGQDINSAQKDSCTRLEMSPLHLVCKLGHLTIVKFLLGEGASVNALDNFHRSPLLIAAQHGYSAICEQLLRYGASIFIMDNMNNTALHMAAFSGSSAIATQVLRCHDDRFRLFLARLPQETGRSYEMVLKDGYESIMKHKLRDNQRRRFHRSWLLETAQSVYSRLFDDMGGEALVSAPQRFFMDYLVDQYANELTTGVLASQDSDGDDDGAGDSPDDSDSKQQSDDPEVWLSLSHMAFYVDRCLRYMYKHLINKQGRTALHVACDENLVCTHERVIHLLAERHGCSPLLRDYSGNRPIDLVLACRGRPGSPKGDAAHEKRLVQEREERRKQREKQQEAQRVAQRRSKWQKEVEQLSADYEELETLARMRADVKAMAESHERNNVRPCTPGNSTTKDLPVRIAGWNIYSEPQSRNRLFENTASGFVQHQVPSKLAQEVRLRLAWKEKMETSARFVERNRFAPEWELYRLNGTDIYFFYNRASGICQWIKPHIQVDDKDKVEMAKWKTKRVFEDEEQLEDEADRESLALVFSGSPSPTIMKNASTRRMLGDWRECVLHFGGEGGATFYVHEVKQELSIEKPEDVLRFERYRYGHGLLQARSEVIEEHANGWERFYDEVTTHTFYYNSSTGDCVHDSFATREFLTSIRKARKLKPKVTDESSLSEKEVLQRRHEEREWRQALVRARRHDELVVQQEKDQVELEKKLKEQDIELEEDIRCLEESIAREHVGAEAVQLGVESNGDNTDSVIIVKDGAYVASRFARELEVFLLARRNQLLTSKPPATTGAMSPRHSEDSEIARSVARELALDELELEDSKLEDVDASVSIQERRRVSRMLVRTAARLPRTNPVNSADIVAFTVMSEEMCRWGCERWFPRQQQALKTHEIRECERRLMICRLGCGLVREARQWHSIVSSNEREESSPTIFIYDHESERKREGDNNLCSFRIVSCPRSCGVWEPHSRLAIHMKDTCVKRPVGDLYCRLSCGEVFRGDGDSQTGHDRALLALEQIRIAHEQDACPMRLVDCTWSSPPCEARIMARDRKAHRKAHVLSSGVVAFLSVGIVHEYKVPRGVHLLKIQAWGAGGGSGMLKARAYGRGGGGAFVEGECAVNPGETLYILVGEGGSAGKSARMVEVNELVEEKQDGSGALAVTREARMETIVGVARGGSPGGGAGHAGNCETACGGGGGFTSVYRKSAYGIEYLVIAGGGGGGGTCRSGGGGAGLRLKMPLLKPGDDDRCGQPGGDEALTGGAAGVCDSLNAFCRFQATAGASMQGGDGAEYGGGGGGGFFGGGGGGFAPGIVGGGGGGSSYANSAVFSAGSVRVEVGNGAGDGKPGGMRENPPPSPGREDEGCVVGEGGSASMALVARGSHGGVRLAQPGFFNDMKDLQ